ncbi:MAG: imidazole glycerol phosphate synthase subunit HisH [Bacteroidales bacterium]|nr:imidazole glycerol phosphate synthase subunit HisH [Bacteroidales bacterium]
MIAIVDYGVGNIRSVVNALNRAGVAEPVLTADRELLSKAEKVVLPGVGDASCAMAALRECGLAEFIPTLTRPVLGICVGLQLMCRRSEEGDVKCMGIFDTDVVRFQPAEGLKIPHMGWNSISGLKTPLFKGLREESYVYYVHSYYPQLCADTIATTSHGVAFSGALANGNFYGTQFHPEKSGEVGAAIIKNFLEL